MCLRNEQKTKMLNILWPNHKNTSWFYCKSRILLHSTYVPFHWEQKRILVIWAWIFVSERRKAFRKIFFRKTTNFCQFAIMTIKIHVFWHPFSNTITFFETISNILESVIVNSQIMWDLCLFFSELNRKSVFDVWEILHSSRPIRWSSPKDDSSFAERPPFLSRFESFEIVSEFFGTLWSRIFEIRSCLGEYSGLILEKTQKTLILFFLFVLWGTSHVVEERKQTNQQKIV